MPGFDWLNRPSLGGARNITSTQGQTEDAPAVAKPSEKEDELERYKETKERIQESAARFQRPDQEMTPEEFSQYEQDEAERVKQAETDKKLVDNEESTLSRIMNQLMGRLIPIGKTDKKVVGYTEDGGLDWYPGLPVTENISIPVFDPVEGEWVDSSGSNGEVLWWFDGEPQWRDPPSISMPPGYTNYIMRSTADDTEHWEAFGSTKGSLLYGLNNGWASFGIGQRDQVLTVIGEVPADYELSWENPPTELPDTLTETEGKVLALDGSIEPAWVELDIPESMEDLLACTTNALIFGNAGGDWDVLLGESADGYHAVMMNYGSAPAWVELDEHVTRGILEVPDASGISDDTKMLGVVSGKAAWVDIPEEGDELPPGNNDYLMRYDTTNGWEAFGGGDGSLIYGASDGWAELTIGLGDEGKILTVYDLGGGDYVPSWEDPPTELPSAAPADDGKILSLNASAEPVWVEAPTLSLPPGTDNYLLKHDGSDWLQFGGTNASILYSDGSGWEEAAPATNYQILNSKGGTPNWDENPFFGTPGNEDVLQWNDTDGRGEWVALDIPTSIDDLLACTANYLIYGNSSGDWAAFPTVASSGYHTLTLDDNDVPEWKELDEHAFREIDEVPTGTVNEQVLTWNTTTSEAEWQDLPSSGDSLPFGSAGAMTYKNAANDEWVTLAGATDEYQFLGYNGSIPEWTTNPFGAATNGHYLQWNSTNSRAEWVEVTIPTIPTIPDSLDDLIGCSIGDILFGSATDVWATLSAADDNYHFLMPSGANAVPAWTDTPFGAGTEGQVLTYDSLGHGYWDDAPTELDDATADYQLLSSNGTANAPVWEQNPFGSGNEDDVLSLNDSGRPVWVSQEAPTDELPAMDPGSMIYMGALDWTELDHPGYGGVLITGTDYPEWLSTTGALKDQILTLAQGGSGYYPTWADAPTEIPEILDSTKILGATGGAPTWVDAPTFSMPDGYTNYLMRATADGADSWEAFGGGDGSLIYGSGDGWVELSTAGVTEGDILNLTSDGVGGYVPEWIEAPLAVPDTTNKDGKILWCIGGAPAWGDKPEDELPSGSTNQMLYYNGGWVALDAPTADYQHLMLSGGTLAWTDDPFGAATEGQILEADNNGHGQWADAPPEVPPAADGYIIYGDGTDWEPLDTGAEGDVLQMVAGFPEWTAISEVPTGTTSDQFLKWNGTDAVWGDIPTEMPAGVDGYLMQYNDTAEEWEAFGGSAGSLIFCDGEGGSWTELDIGNNAGKVLTIVEDASGDFNIPSWEDPATELPSGATKQLLRYDNVSGTWVSLGASDGSLLVGNGSNGWDELTTAGTLEGYVLSITADGYTEWAENPDELPTGYRGSMLYKSAAGWSDLPHDGAGYILKTNANDPEWLDPGVDGYVLTSTGSDVAWEKIPDIDLGTTAGLVYWNGSSLSVIANENADYIGCDATTGPDWYS